MLTKSFITLRAALICTLLSFAPVKGIAADHTDWPTSPEQAGMMFREACFETGPTFAAFKSVMHENGFHDHADGYHNDGVHHMNFILTKEEDHIFCTLFYVLHTADYQNAVYKVSDIALGEVDLNAFLERYQDDAYSEMINQREDLFFEHRLVKTEDGLATFHMYLRRPI